MLSLVSPFHTTLVSLALVAGLVSADRGVHEHNRLDLNRRHHVAVNLTERDVHLEKRFGNIRFTFFDVGVNACGGFDHDNDFIVALNTHQWDNGAHCFKPISISYQGKTTNAKITDECEGCPWDAIDLSPGLFSYLVSEGLGQGEVYGSWSFGGGDEPKPEPEPEPEPKTTTTTHEKPTTTHSSTSTTEERPTSTSSSSRQSTSTSSSKTSMSSSSSIPSSSTSSAPVATVTSFDTGTFNQVNLAMVQLVELMFVSSDAA